MESPFTQMINANNNYNDIWQACLLQIKNQTSQEEFVQWFKPIVPVNFDGAVLQLRVPNENYVYHIEKNYIPFLRPIIYQMFGQQTRLRYSFPANQSQPVHPQDEVNSTIARFIEQNDSANIKNPFVIPGIKKTAIDSQLNPNYTIENFIEGDCNLLARSAGLAIAKEPGSTPYNPLYIYGDSGLGKTHIAHAIGLEIQRIHPELRVLYVSMNRFQAQFTAAALSGGMNDFIHFYQTIDVLIIDDIQELSGVSKEKTQGAFFNIFNHLQMSGKQLILTSDKRPVELKDLSERLLTRFKWGLAAELHIPDFDTKCKIIQSKAARLNKELTPEVVDFLAENINANVREIEGALSSLVAHAAFLNKSITVALAKDILQVYVKNSRHEITVNAIRDAVCKTFAISAEMLDSHRRTRDIVQARQIAMFLCKKHTKLQLVAIGQSIGHKNHATVLHACNTVSNLLETDKKFATLVNNIEAQLFTK